MRQQSVKNEEYGNNRGRSGVAAYMPPDPKQ
jgi:hypothetical protein